MKTKLFVLALILIVITNAYFKYTEREEIIQQNKELVQTIITVDKTINDYKEIVNEVENDPCLTEGAAAAVVDSAVIGGDSYTETGYIDPSMVIMDSVLIVTSKVLK